MIIDMMRPRRRVLDVLRDVAANYGRVIASETDGIGCLAGDLEIQVRHQALGTTRGPHTFAVFDPPAAIHFFVVLEPGRQSVEEMATILATEFEIAAWCQQKTQEPA